MNTTTQPETVNVNVQKDHGLGNQQPSALTGEGSTTIRKEYTQVSGSAGQTI